LRADRALAAFARDLQLREGERVERLADVDADVVVCTAGSWARELLAQEGIELPVRISRETVAYFRLPDARPIPSVVTFKPDRHQHDIYALADPQYGLKAGTHHAGPEVGAGETGDPDPELVRRIAGWAADVFQLDDPGPA